MRKTLRIGITVSAALAAALLPSAALGAPATAGGVEWVSSAPGGAPGNDRSSDAVISGDGQKVAFMSTASNLVPGDTTGSRDIFVRDLTTGVTQRVNTTATDQTEVQPDPPSISRDGRYVAFGSTGDLTPGDGDQMPDVFVRDLQTGALERIDSLNASAKHPTLSADGRYVAYIDGHDVYLRDRTAGTTERISVTRNGLPSDAIRVSSGNVTPDGRYVSFISDSPNIVQGDTNGRADLFLRDRQTGKTERVNVSSTGQVGNGFVWTWEAPGISDDGRHLAFQVDASNLVAGDTNGTADVFVRDRTTGTTKRINTAHGGGQSMPPFELPGRPDFQMGISVSSDGRYITYAQDAFDLVPNDTNGRVDVFQYDQQTGATQRLTRTSTGAQTGTGNWATLNGGQQSVTPDGSRIAVALGGTGVTPEDTGIESDVFTVTRP